MTYGNAGSAGQRHVAGNRLGAEHAAESFVRELVDHFSAPGNEFEHRYPWCGTDVKLMAYAAEELDVVLCVPQKSSHVASRVDYLANREVVLAECARLAARRLGDIPTRFRLNVRDIPERDELYLTFTGSSIESGDEGVVGRGNRVNGLITPLRPMNVEGVNGKNPVYHVGKLYNVAARGWRSDCSRPPASMPRCIWSARPGSGSTVPGESWYASPRRAAAGQGQRLDS